MPPLPIYHIRLCIRIPIPAKLPNIPLRVIHPVTRARADAIPPPHIRSTVHPLVAVHPGAAEVLVHVVGAGRLVAVADAFVEGDAFGGHALLAVPVALWVDQLLCYQYRLTTMKCLDCHDNMALS